MNAVRARERRRAQPARVETRKVHRTRPLLDVDDRGRTRLVGHGCNCCDRTFTAAGRLSQPRRILEDGVTVAPSKLHGRRVSALRRSRGVRGLVSRLRGDAA